MRKFLLIVIVLLLFVSCSQDVTPVYTAKIENRSSYSLYWRIRRTEDLEVGVFNRISAYQRQYVLIQNEENYSVDFILYDANGETKNQGSFTIENPLNIEAISFSSRGYKVSWEISYKTNKEEP